MGSSTREEREQLPWPLQLVGAWAMPGHGPRDYVEVTISDTHFPWERKIPQITKWPDAKRLPRMDPKLDEPDYDRRFRTQMVYAPFRKSFKSADPYKAAREMDDLEFKYGKFKDPEKFPRDKLDPMELEHADPGTSARMQGYPEYS